MSAARAEAPGAFEPSALKPVYALIGDESYVRDRFRRRLLERVPEEERGFSVFDFDLNSTPFDEVLDQARTPSLMAPLQLFFVRGVKNLFARAAAAEESQGATSAAKGKKKHGGFPENIERFARESPRPPAAVVVLIADHLHLPADRQRISLEDKTRLQRLETVLGGCGEIVYCARMSEAQAADEARRIALRESAELTPEAAGLLTRKLDSDLGLIQSEVKKLALHALPERRIGRDAVEALVAGAHAASGFELAEAISAAGGGKRDARRRCFDCLVRVWAESGDAGAIGIVYQLSRAFTMALILRQERVRDRSGLYRALPEGLRPPGFAADQILAISRAMDVPRLSLAIESLHAADVELRSSPPSPRLVFERLIWGLSRGQ